MYLVKLEQEQAEREYQKEQEERRRRAQEAKRRKRFLDAAFDGDNDELLAILKEVGLDVFVYVIECKKRTTLGLDPGLPIVIVYVYKKEHM